MKCAKSKVSCSNCPLKWNCEIWLELGYLESKLKALKEGDDC